MITDSNLCMVLSRSFTTEIIREKVNQDYQNITRDIQNYTSKTHKDDDNL